MREDRHPRSGVPAGWVESAGDEPETKSGAQSSDSRVLSEHGGPMHGEIRSGSRWQRWPEDGSVLDNAVSGSLERERR